MKYQNKNKIKIVDGIIKRKETVVLPIQQLKINPRTTMFYSGLKMTGVGVIVLSLFFSLSFIGGTVAYFSDSETSFGNKMQAGVITFNISSSEQEGQLLKSASLAPDSEVVDTEEQQKSVGTGVFVVDTVPNESSLPLLYSVNGEFDSDSPPSCDLMTVKVFFGDYHYNGLVKDFVSPKVSEMGQWRFVIELPPVNDLLSPNAQCKGSMVFNAELADVSDDLSKTYTDKKAYKFELYNWDAPAPSEAIIEDAPIEVIAPKEALEEALSPLLEEIPSEDLIAPTEVLEPEPELLEEPVEESKEPLTEPLSEPLLETLVDIPGDVPPPAETPIAPESEPVI